MNFLHYGSQAPCAACCWSPFYGIVERLIVRDHIFPAIPTNEILDQYGFKPSGSTTAALVDLTHKFICHVRRQQVCALFTN